MAPLCIDLKELPSPETLHSRMTSIALENGLLGGIGEDVVNVMLFAAEVKMKRNNAICTHFDKGFFFFFFGRIILNRL